MKKLISLLLIGCFCVASTPLVAEQPIVFSNKMASSDGITEVHDIESDILQYRQVYGSIQKPSYVPGEIVVNFRSAVNLKTNSTLLKYVTTGFSGVDQLNKKFQVTSIEKVLDDMTFLELENCYLLHVSNTTNIETAVAQYERSPEVAYAEPNYLYYHCMMPNDPLFGQQWSLHNNGQTGGTPDADIDAPEAWDLETGDPEVIIAVLDSGIDYTNPDCGNYTAGVTEEPYVLESPHPLNMTVYQTTVDFPNCDAVSFHISQFNVSPILGLLIKSPVVTKLTSKQLFYSIFYNGTGENLWTRFSEYRGTKDITVQASGQNHWGFSIDKVKKILWRPLSEMSPLFADGYDFYYRNRDPMDDNGHGTHCAGIIASATNNAQGVAGIAYNCTIMPLKVCGPVLGGTTHVYIARALSYAVSHHADIISMSLGGPKSRTMSLALTAATNKGVVLIAAAGNSNINEKTASYPAGHPDVLAVAATDQNDSKAYFSNFGSWVDVAAPGVDIVSLRAFGSDMYVLDHTAEPGSHFVPPFDANATAYRASGTSMACPHAAGIAGLILSKNPTLNPQQLRTILRSSADPVHSPLPIGTGRINADTALTITVPVIAEFDASLDDQIAQGAVEIRGIAQGEGFMDYDVAYAYGIYPSEDQWIPLVHSTTPTEGVLTELDTTPLWEGLYSIRLSVNASGFLYTDLAVIVVDNQHNTFYVDDDNSNGPWYGTEEDPFQLIQYAMECCGSLDEIQVASGIYKESLNIGKEKSIHLHGEDKTTTFLVGLEKNSAGFLLSSARFTIIEGFTVTNFSFGLFLMKSMGNRIYNNRFINNTLSGIVMLYSVGNLFYENEFINNTNHTIGGYNLNLWYHPLKLRGNYWDDYTELYPNAHPRTLFSWSWDTPYKISFLWSFMEWIPPVVSALLRFTWNNDRFPLITPSTM
jgi:parallel beta-helix repeat protein